MVNSTKRKVYFLEQVLTALSCVVFNYFRFNRASFAGPVFLCLCISFTGCKKNAVGFAGGGQSGLCLDQVDLEIHFFLDTTNSLSENFAPLRANVVALAGELEDAIIRGGSLGVNIKYAYTLYSDADMDPANVPLTRLGLDSREILSAFQSLSINDVQGNGDGPEAGLWAMEEAISSLAQTPQTITPFRIWIVVTDNYSHRSREVASNFNRDYSLLPVVSGINRLLTGAQTMLLFDSTPTFEPEDRWSNGQQVQPTYEEARIVSPAQQWGLFRELSGGKVQGSNVPYPINAEVMLGQIPQSVLAYKNQLCQ